MIVKIEIPNASIEYLESSARIRRTSPTGLIERLVAIALYDQMILSILDDEDEVVHLTNAADTILEQTREKARREKIASRPTVRYRKSKYNPSIGIAPRKASVLTKSEMQNDLRNAVLNTGGVVVE
jgi:hypothetical protein